jgi:hypothetical protein
MTESPQAWRSVCEFIHQDREVRSYRLEFIESLRPIMECLLIYKINAMKTQELLASTGESVTSHGGSTEL